MNGELHLALDTRGFSIQLPVEGEGRARLVGTVGAEA